MPGMKRVLIIAVLLAVVSCRHETKSGWFNAEKAREYFTLTEEICNEDNGNLWGENLYGPILYVETATRTLYANVPDNEGLLKEKEGVYTGILPKERIINTVPIDLGGVLYAMVPLPETEDQYRITSRTMHSLFHCFQERHDLKPSTFSTRHMFDKNARLMLKLEWKALTIAISCSGEKRDQALRDALIFRCARRELFPEAVADENKFEDYEGLATFTYVWMCTSSQEEATERILNYLDRIYQNNSYAGGYGFVHGALYAILLNDLSFDFTLIKSADYDLGLATRELYNVTLPEVCRDVAGSLAFHYDIHSIWQEESKWEEKINENIRLIVARFNEKPIVTIAMESPNFSFEPEDIQYLDTLGTYYRKLRVSDNWGRLAVEDGGALLTNDLRTLRVSAKELLVERNQLSGAGWHLMLNDGWRGTSAGDGSYTITKQEKTF